MTLYSLNTARKVDLEKIVEMRKGEIDHRHDMTYIYAFTTALIVKHQGATTLTTLADVLKLIIYQALKNRLTMRTTSFRS